MHVIQRSFWLQKSGNAPEEYEDAFCPDGYDEVTNVFRVAIADGASETAFSGDWAEWLVHAYCDGVLATSSLARGLLRLQRRWLKFVSRPSLPWYLEEKIRQGAYSSLTGLTLKENSEQRSLRNWEATAVGDSCLFQIRDNVLLTSWPLSRADEFTNRPTLLSSNSLQLGDVANHIKNTSGEWKAGDTFYLMTDALARWFLQAIGPTRDLTGVTRVFQSITRPGELSDAVRNLRAAHLLHNDDITLLQIIVI